MTPFIETERLFLHRHIFEDGTILSCLDKKNQMSSPQALSELIKRNKGVLAKVFGWWCDIASPYSAGFHIKRDERAWRAKKQLQYYVYDKKNERCIGIFCAIIDSEKQDAYMLTWLEKAAQNKGYAHEVATHVEKELFVNLNVKTITYECFDVNKDAYKMASFLAREGYKQTFTNHKSIVWQKRYEDYAFAHGLELKVNLKRKNNFFALLKAIFSHQNG